MVLVVMPMFVVSRKERQGEKEDDDGDNQAARCSDGKESTDGIVLISLSRGAHDDRGDQGSAFIALHFLFIQDSTHDEG